MAPKLLVIDDEEALCEILKYNLEREGYIVDTAFSAEDALTMPLAEYDLIIADIMMEAISGFEFARRIRASETTARVPIIFCTALTDEDNTVAGLELGADDYITKPFTVSQVLARVRAVLRRSGVVNPSSSNSTEIRYKTLCIDTDKKTVTIDSRVVELTYEEFELLLFFVTHRNRIYTRDEILARLSAVFSDSFDSLIKSLREKIGDYGNNILTRGDSNYGFKESN